MKIEGMTTDNAWAARVLRDRGVQVEQITGLGADVVAEIEQVDLLNHGEDLNYRPYLHLQGSLQSVVPSERLPHDIHEVTFAPGQGKHVDTYYEFNDAQLAALARKGYFNQGFAVPQQIVGLPWELPVTMDAVVLSPAHAEDVPVVMVNVHDLGSVNTDLGSSGYDLVEYFENQSEQAEGDIESVADLGVIPVHQGKLTPLFGPEVFEQGEKDAYRDPELLADDEPVAVVGLDAKLQEVAAAVEAEQEARHQGRAAEAGTLENVYEERVAKALDRRAAAQEAVRVAREEVEAESQDGIEDAVPELDAAAGARNLEKAKQNVADRAQDLEPRLADEDEMDY